MFFRVNVESRELLSDSPTKAKELGWSWCSPSLCMAKETRKYIPRLPQTNR